MAYQTGTATGPHQLLDTIRAFALSIGYTQNRYNTSIGSNTNGNELCLSKGSSFFNLASFEDSTDNFDFFQSIPKNRDGVSGVYSGVCIIGSDGYSSGAEWYDQIGTPYRLNRPLLSHVFDPGPYPSYHLFSPDNECDYLELEYRSNVYQRLGFGKLDTYGNPGGDGRFYYATTSIHDVDRDTYYSRGVSDQTNSFEMVPFRGAEFIGSNISYLSSASYVRVQTPAYDGWACSANTSGSSKTGEAVQGGGHEDVIAALGFNNVGGRAIQTPIIVSYNSQGQFLMPIGAIPGMRRLRMDLYQPGEEFNLGSDTWKVFPWWQKGGNSSQHAISYLRVD